MFTSADSSLNFHVIFLLLNVRVVIDSRREDICELCATRLDKVTRKNKMGYEVPRAVVLVPSLVNARVNTNDMSNFRVDATSERIKNRCRYRVGYHGDIALMYG